MEVIPSQEQRDPAVSVKDAYKRYTKHAIVLKGLNMTVAAGTM